MGLLAGSAHGEAPMAPAVSETPNPGGRVFADHHALTLADSGHYVVSSAARPAVNALPFCTIVDDSYATSAQTPVSQNVRDNDGPAGSSAPVASFTQAAHGSVNLDVQADSGNGSFVYTPDPGFSGADSFTYTVSPTPPNCTLGNVTATATVALTVNPVATADAFTVPVGQSASGNVLTNDIGSNLTVTSNTSPSHGNANVASDGSFFYAPLPGYSGPDSFQYTLQSAGGGQATGTVTLQVGAAAVVTSTPATGTAALGLLGTLLAWFGLRRRRED